MQSDTPVFMCAMLLTGREGETPKKDTHTHFLSGLELHQERVWRIRTARCCFTHSRHDRVDGPDAQPKRDTRHANETPRYCPHCLHWFTTAAACFIFSFTSNTLAFEVFSSEWRRTPGPCFQSRHADFRSTSPEATTQQNRGKLGHQNSTHGKEDRGDGRTEEEK